jgi:hypothetical protein
MKKMKTEEVKNKVLKSQGAKSYLTLYFFLFFYFFSISELV